jgi:hypothetical protein
MLGIIGAAEDFSVDNEVLGVLGILQLEVPLWTGVANSAPVITAAVGRTYLGAASIMSHAPMVDGAEGFNVVTHLIWGHNVLGHYEFPRLQ